jgi:hypothetical protein
VNNDAGLCTAEVTLTAPTTNDNCAVQSVVSDHPSTTYPVGTTVVTWTVTDIHGNINTCTQSVTVTDNEAPSITCAGPVSVNNDAGLCTAVITLTAPTTNDNCAVQSVVSNHPSTTYPVGTTVVTWTVTDIHGNINTCTQSVTVTDNEAPSITCAGPVSVNNDAGLCTAEITLTAPTTNDNCAVQSVVSDHPSTTYPVGTTVVTWTVTDIHSNINTCTQSVTVTDNEAPSITCAGPVSVNNDAGLCTAEVTLTAPTTNDNCAVQSVVSDHPSTTYPVGTTVVTWTVTDIHSNINTCTQSVTVTDNEAPSITCAGPVSVNNDAGLCTAEVTLTAPTTNDNCAVQSVVSDHPSTTYPVGTTVVTWTVTDIHSNINTCTQSVTVTDNEQPVISGCPSDITINSEDANPLTCTQVVNWTAPTVIDNCAMQSFVSNHNPGEAFPVGTTLVTYTATDIHGNISVCSFNVTVNDNTQPTFTSCPSPVINAPINTAGCIATVVTSDPLYTDNCGVTKLTWALTGATTGSSPVTGINLLGTHAFNVGLTTVTYTAEDASGNIKTCIFTVSVVNTLAGNIAGTAVVLQNGPTTPNITFSGSGGTKPYTFAYTVSYNGGAPGPLQTVSTTGLNSIVTVPQSNAVLGEYVYTLVSITDAFGCTGTLPVDNQDTITVSTTIPRPDLYAEVLYPPASFYTGLVREGYVTIANAAPYPTTGTIVFRISKLQTFNFELLGSTTSVFVDGVGTVLVDNTNWTISSSLLYYTLTSKPGVVIPANGSVDIGYKLTATSGANTTGIMTVTIFDGTGGSTPTNGDSVDGNNQAVKLFFIN